MKCFKLSNKTQKTEKIAKQPQKIFQNHPKFEVGVPFPFSLYSLLCICIVQLCGCRRNVSRTNSSLFTFSLPRRTRERSQMQDIFGSVRRSLVFRGSPETEETSLGVGGSLVDKISYCIRTSRVFSKPSPPSPSIPVDAAPPIRWRKGELIGCGAFGQVYVGMNIDSGELLAVKQVNYFLHPLFVADFIVNLCFLVLSSFRIVLFFGVQLLASACLFFFLILYRNWLCYESLSLRFPII